MPMHYAEPAQWLKLLAKQQDYPYAKFLNEILGESFDRGAKLISEAQLAAASQLGWENNTQDIRHQVQIAKRYFRVFMGVDWGGGGADEISFTTVAVVGMHGDGRLDVIYGERMFDDPVEEAKRIRQLYNAFNCKAFAHDFNGAGNIREAYLVHAGMPMSHLYPFVYNRTASKDMVVPHLSGDNDHNRNYYILDKARSLQLTCEMIKQKRIQFFNWDYKNVDNRGLIHDFTSLIEHKYETARAGEVYGIQGAGTFPDDFAHSVNFACVAFWHSTKKYPNIADPTRYILTQQQHQAFNPGPISGLDELSNFVET